MGRLTVLSMLPVFRSGFALSLRYAMQKLRFYFSKQGFDVGRLWHILRSQLSLLLFFDFLCLI